MNSLVYFAIVLVIIWIVARVFLAVTSVLLHLLWVLAVILFVVWVINRVSS